MGMYFNPSNDGFRQALRSQIYVDKTGMIEFFNGILETEQKFAAVSRARRFGKSMAVKLLVAYYSKSCDSRELFKGLKAETLPSFESELNKSNVITFDVQNFRSLAKNEGRPLETLAYIQKEVIKELRLAYPQYVIDEDISLPTVLARINQNTREQFIIIIDEWDCIFREEKNNKQAQEEYINFLRAMFKGQQAESFVKLAYITGILPIKKYGTQSALNNFKEYTMAKPDQLAEYVGFSQEEVEALCNRFNMDFEECRRWYDGYSFEQINSIYNPNSVVEAMLRHSFGSYWTKTDTYEVLRDYIAMNMDGLRDDITSMLAGNQCRIRTEKFSNDMVTFNSKDDVMTLLVHLGYLAYNSETGMVRIPNREIAGEFANAVEDQEYWGELAKAIRLSDDFLDAIIAGKADFVAEQLQRVHSDDASVLQYNDENSLACAIRIAFYTSYKYYTLFRELPTGEGFADIVYIPKKKSEYPALLIELKYNRNADSAIKQIKEKRYTGKLLDYADNLILVGINYGKRSRKHTCKIERFLMLNE